MKKTVSTFKRYFARPGDEREALHALLESADPAASLTDRVVWFERLLDWMRAASTSRHSFDESRGELRNARLRFLLHLLGRNAEWRTRFSGVLLSLGRETSALNLFCQVGLGRHHGFLSEAMNRIVRRTLPQPLNERDLSELFARVFRYEEDAVWIPHVTDTLVRELLTLIHENVPDDEYFPRWHEELLVSLTILGSRVAFQGTTPEILQRTTEHGAFLELAESLYDLSRAARVGEYSVELVDDTYLRCDDAKKVVAELSEELEVTGVSVSLVYTLETLASSIDRVRFLAGFLDPRLESVERLTVEFVSQLAQDSVAARTLKGLVQTNLHMLARKVVERAGATGEHYIARTRAEYFSMLKCGLGGGMIMVFTTLVKFSIHSIHPPLFVEAVLFSLNYAGSFLLLQSLGFTLATKQPSATASALAVKLTDLNEEGEIRSFVDEACRMTRSQFASLLGNLFLLVPFAVAVDFGINYLFGHHFLTVAQARNTLDSLNPLVSFTIFNAALTGVLLWISSVTAGWFENWLVYRRVPEALATHRRLIHVLGAPRAKRIGEWVTRNATLVGGNVSLGLMMGFTSIAGTFFGLPIDVRHVTLSAASLTFSAMATISAGLDWRILLLPALGILVIGALNFAVSYSLAFWVASRAKKVPTQTLLRLLRAMRARLRNHPMSYFFP